MELVFATNNQNKLSEIRSLINSSVKILSLEDIGCSDELPETNPTLKLNAYQKAKYVFDKFGYDCFSDDSGLEIHALNGEPGVYSARYAGEDCNAKNNINKVLLNLKNNKNRNANFRTVISLLLKGESYFFEGTCQGSISEAILGSNGFGYDPIFIPSGTSMTFAEMSKFEKGKLSHRSKAVKKLIEFLNNENKVVVIGSGFSGLSAAAFLAKSKMDVTVVEKNDQLGGRARVIKENGYVFDMGPSWYWMPDIFENFFNEFDVKTQDFYNLLELNPGFKMIFQSDELEISSDFNEVCTLFEKYESGASDKLKDFIADAQKKYLIGIDFMYKSPGVSFLNFFLKKLY